MHLVIPTRVANRNRSLDRALASISAHTEYTPVTIGHDPKASTLHIATRQGRDPFANTNFAMLTACTTAWISDPFIWSNDDIYWTRQAEPIRWAIGLLQDDQRTNIYGKRKRLTLSTLRRLGYPTWDYESHTPLLVSKASMLTALRLPGTMRSLYGNLTGLPTVVAPDVKVRRHSDPTPDGPWLSTAHPALLLQHSGA